MTDSSSGHGAQKQRRLCRDGAPTERRLCFHPNASVLESQRPEARDDRGGSKMDFTNPDSQPALKLNELIWKSVKGPNSKMPAPVNPSSGDDDD